VDCDAVKVNPRCVNCVDCISVSALNFRISFDFEGFSRSNFCKTYFVSKYVDGGVRNNTHAGPGPTTCKALITERWRCNVGVGGSHNFCNNPHSPFQRGAGISQSVQ
jgi:hypothetical protein